MAGIVTRAELLLFWISTIVHPSVLQPPLPLSLPVHMAAVPPSWKFLPLSQADLGPLFSNSSPFSFSQSVFLLPPPGQTPRPGLQASFGPYSATQLLPKPFLPPLSASLLSESVERERAEGGQESFRVRVLFHKPGHDSPGGSCVTLHAFRETEEHRASCIPQPPLGLCVASLSLPGGWFEDRHSTQLRRDLDQWYSSIRPGHRMQKRGRHRRGNLQRAASSKRNHPGDEADAFMKPSRALQSQQSPRKEQIQLYYSALDNTADVKLTAAGCVQDGPAQSQNKLFYIKAVSLREQENLGANPTQEETCLNGQEGEELDVDSHVMIRYHRGPVLIGQPVKVSVTLRANFSAHLVVIRLRVKKGLVSMVAQRTPTSELWAVTLERSQGSKHDVVSIFCHKHRPLAALYDRTRLQQVVCLSIDGLKQSFGVAMTVSAEWWVEYSGRKNLPPPHGAAVSTFSFADRYIFGIAPITESNTIINTAILTNRPVSLPVIVLAVGRHDKMSDVTAAVTCRSTNENTIKVSSDCSSVFVDGSESGLGDTCAEVEFQLGSLRGSVCLNVWAPSIPLRVSLSDPVLNAIRGWNVFTDDGCVPVYQRSSVQVLTRFTARDAHGRKSLLLGSADWFVDVTELVHDWLRVEDPRVAFLSPQNTLVGLRPGKTSLHVVSEQWDGVLGRCDLTVSPEPVTPGDLSVQVVGGLGMSITSSPAHPAIVTTTVTAYNIMYNHHQEASVSVWLQFDDDTSSLLSTFSDLPSSLQLSSLAESVVAVTSGPGQHVLAQGDGGGPLVQAELLVSACSDQLIISNSISEEEDGEWRDSGGGGGGGGTRRLARGSGWVRVNLDLGLLQKADEEFEFDISDMLVESDSDVYTSTQDEGGNSSTSNDYFEKIGNGPTDRKWNEVRNEGMVSRNTLERAVLMPNQEEGTLYFSPSQDRAEERGRGRGEGSGQGTPELEIGMGTVLSLLCLTAVLFMVNCLPCALRDRRRKARTNGETEAEPEGGAMGAEEEEERQEAKEQRTEETHHTEGEDKLPDNTEEEVKEVEIIC